MQGPKVTKKITERKLVFLQNQMHLKDNLNSSIKQKQFYKNYKKILAMFLFDPYDYLNFSWHGKNMEQN